VLRVTLVPLTPERFDETVTAFCDAFRDYPVMRYVIGDRGDSYDDLLGQLIGYFTESRFARRYPVIGIESDDGRIVAAANINPPLGMPAPPSLQRTYRSLCNALGSEAIARYDAFAEACSPFEPEDPHFHLGMIGVVHDQQGRGYARRLLDAVHEMSSADSGSTGVSLTTETPRNLPFYEHFGYRILGRGETPDGLLETWTLFRADES
jgi:GNAT superfamily N-acetyltransferase